MRNEAGRLLVTVREMLAPASASPSPQRMKLDKAMRDLELALAVHDRLRSPYANTGPSEGFTTTEALRPAPPPPPPSVPPTKRLKEHQSNPTEGAKNG